VAGIDPVNVIAGAAAIDIPSTWVAISAVAVPESFIWNSTLVVPLPDAKGVPESTPAEERLNPAGNI
jgi:hypothetical protein